MKAARIGWKVAIVLCACALGGTAARAQNEKDRVEIDWRRDPKAAIRPAAPGVPAAPDLPAELAIPHAVAAPRVEASRGTRPAGAGYDVDGLAMRAGENVALEAAREWGWRQYWRAGFARGAAVALEDPRLGGWDREEGRRFGRFDPRARMLGDRIANDAAREGATREAESRVRGQFMDLASEPRRDRSMGRGQSPLGTVPTSSGPWAIAPVFDQVFVAYPFAKTPGLSREGRRAIEDWNVEPAMLARNDRGAMAYDARWKDPAFAFSIWRDRQRRGSYWSQFGSSQRERFRQVFFDQFDATLGSLDLRPTYAGWRVGFEDGWRYGAAVQAEWAYRQGYAEGFDLGVQETAAIAFPYAFDRAYAAAYDASFDDWSTHPHPDLTGAQLTDETDDGVFEPGERVFVEADVVNYGGAPGTFALVASGGDLDGTAETSVRLTGRGRAPAGRALALRVNDRVPPRTRTAVTVTIGDARLEAPLYVSRPLAIEGEPTIDADRLAGRVTLTFDVTNTSRREARGVVLVEPLTGPREAKRDDLGVIAAGRSRQASFTFEGLHPLDLIGGEARWSASVARGETLDDLREIGIAPVATDLGNPDLLDFMLALARSPRVSRSDVQDARALMMERLRADWERAAAVSGNPYKRDFESEGSETALGELVRATKGSHRSFASPQVFDGLRSDVTALSEELPGAHPLLRKWMKKLASRVG